MTVADLLYPFSFAYRWGAKPARDGGAADNLIVQSTATLRERLAGLRILRTEQDIRKFGPDLEFIWQVPVVEVYLQSTPPDSLYAAAVAPPWSTLPWHLLALMEEAVQRGLAAFSLEEAKRRGVAWLDLVRDQSLLGRLAAVTEELERAGYVPEALKEFVGPDQATQRWAALRQHLQKHGHLLVTNGPYRLEKWAGAETLLQVFRDVSYPLGVGSFDQYVLPPKAYLSRVEQRGHGLQIRAEMEKAVRAQRTHTLVREPLTRGATAGPYPVHPVCTYMVVAPGGVVVRAGAGSFAPDGACTIDLKGLKSARYQVITAIVLNDNSVNPDIRTLEYRGGR